MSDFLSNFDKKNYSTTLNDKKEKKEESEINETRSARNNQPAEKKSEPEIKEDTVTAEITDSEVFSERLNLTEETDTTDTEKLTDFPVLTETRSGEEETEIDPTYKKRKKRNLLLGGGASLLGAVLLFVIIYQVSHVKMPDLVGKPISDAREWSSTVNVKLDVEQEYNFKNDVNIVIKQEAKAGKKVKKKSSVKLVSSLGPDPEDIIPFADFSKMSKSGADEWVAEKKAENLSVLEEYSDTVEKGKFVRQEINNKEVKPENYRRKDQAVVYYSKGQEVFEKNLPVPEFVGKPKTEVEAWVKTNEIKMEYKEIDSDKIEEGLIVSQSIAKGTKVAKRDTMAVEVSTGKSVIIPNFADYNPETATTVEGLTVTVKTVFSSSVGYGQLIAQSIEAGTKVKIKEPKTIVVTYSAGRPYLRSYFGQLEGDLDKLFFEDYRSKGANIRYNTYFVDSAEERGKVVDMSTYNEFVSLDYVVDIAISNGSRASRPTESPGGSGGDSEPNTGKNKSEGNESDF